MSELKKKLNKALPGIARRLQNELIVAAPVDTGRLKNSIKVTAVKDGVVIIMVDYARFVEFGCFFKDTIIIKTKKGSKKLKDLKIGEEVWTGKKYKKVTQKEEIKIKYPINKITMKTKTKKIEITEDHPIWTTGGWKKARDLKKGDKIKRTW